MFALLSNKKLINYIIILFFLKIFICFPIFSEENNLISKAELSLIEICKGIFIKDNSITFPNYKLYDVKGNEKKLSNNNEFKFSLTVTCSPYLCGSCKRANIELVNHLAEEYPGRVNLVVENFYIRDTKKSIDGTQISKGVNVFLDNKGKNIKELKKLNNKLNGAFYLITDKDRNIEYLVGKSYYFTSKEYDVKIFRKINEYMQIKN
ncbi:MAG: hypothetical protein KGY75_07350 [Candidatus Cloacimonetes bacterium]|nr:hypothetical protein [Candidatus Cloacimonadota bacterium]